MMNTPRLLTTLETHIENFRDAVHYWTGKNEKHAHTAPDANSTLLKPREGGMWRQPVLTCHFYMSHMPTVLCSFAHLGALKIHHNDEHDKPLPPPFTRFDRHVHSCEDVPKCRHCRREFMTWQALQTHIQTNCCALMWLACQDGTLSGTEVTSPLPPEPSLSATSALQTHSLEILDERPLVQQSPLRHFMLRCGWMAMISFPAACERLKHNCAYCEQWIGDGKMKLHYQRIHSDVWNRSGTLATLDGGVAKAGAVSPC